LYSGRAQHSNAALIASSLLLGLFWQQSGWLSHDFLHHQVFKRRSVNNFMGYLMGNVGQGFSVGWWKQKHNSHHAAPNIDGQDPDIDTMPILGWSIHALEELKSYAGLRGQLGSLMIRYQKYTYFPVLAGARLLWCRSSLRFALTSPEARGWTAVVEVATLLMHWVLYLGSLAYTLSAGRALIYFLASQGSCGLLLALVFSLNHNGMPVYSMEESVSMEFYRKQVLTGRDVLPSLFANWFTGM
jgi:fatty acid desaturase